jgi:vitellogenic carboxypeptidase-like protein
MLKVALLLLLAQGILGEFPMQPKAVNQRAIQEDVGETLYLTPYIQSGDIANGQQMAKVVDPLPGIESSGLESYSGFITTNPATNSNMFFWFFPATDVDPAQAPVVIWLQGGPGSSSMFGLFEIHGPISAVFGDSGETTGELNPYTWNKKANMIYIDNPIGAGFSFGDYAGLPATQVDAGDDLYEFLIQWFTLFPEYQPNDFYVFGESYAGKWVPTIGRRIHEMNPTADVHINLVGLGIGNGFMSPPDSSIYADFLYQGGYVDGSTRDEMLSMENNMKNYCANEQWPEAWAEWNREFSFMLNEMGCSYAYDVRQCHNNPEEDNYADYVQLDLTRKASHVGDRPFGSQSSDVYFKMIGDFMCSQKEDVEFLLEVYRVLIYDGAMDIICNHSGVLAMFDQMTNWSGSGNEYYNAPNEVHLVDGEVSGYIKTVRNLKLFTMRNAGHMAPRSQPTFGLDMFERFLDDTL